MASAKRLRAVGVRTLPDDEERRVLSERNRAVDRCGRRLETGSPRCHVELPTVVDHRLDVLRGRAAAAADDPDPQIRDEGSEVGSQRQRVRSYAISPSTTRGKPAFGIQDTGTREWFDR